jgi:hypothetical protein
LKAFQNQRNGPWEAFKVAGAVQLAFQNRMKEGFKLPILKSFQKIQMFDAKWLRTYLLNINLKARFKN